MVVGWIGSKDWFGFGFGLGSDFVLQTDLRFALLVLVAGPGGEKLITRTTLRDLDYGGSITARPNLSCHINL